MGVASRKNKHGKALKPSHRPCSHCGRRHGSGKCWYKKLVTRLTNKYEKENDECEKMRIKRKLEKVLAGK